MHIFISIGPINLDLSTLISFILGISFGFFLMLLIYLYSVLKSLDKGLKFRKADEEDIDEEEIKMLILDAQSLFKNKSERDRIGFFKYLLDINRELSVDIASKFYPNSRYPYLELTIDETLKLNHYITDRVEEMLSGKILGLTRGMTLSKIVEMNNTRVKIENNPFVKTAKKFNKVTQVAVATMNAVNPVYWIRKGTTALVLPMIMVKIGMSIIAITGEETYKIYSKKMFNEEKTIDTGIDELYQDIEKVTGDDDL